MLRNPWSSSMFLANNTLSFTFIRCRSKQRVGKSLTKSINENAMPGPESWKVADRSMDKNPNLMDLTLDGLKSFMTQNLLGKFTAVFPKLFKSQWNTHEGQKKVS